MFRYLRTKLKKIVFWAVITAFLVTIFLFWGMDYDTTQMTGTAAFIVDGTEIDIRTYEDVVSRYISAYRGQEITEQLRRDIRKQAAEDLINQELLKQSSEKMGLYVTKEELKGHVRSEFPNDDVYRSYLVRAPAAWWQMIEESTDKRIKVSRARFPLLDATWVSDAEWRKIVSDLYWEVDLSQILIAPVKEVTDTDVIDFYNANRHRILEPTKIRARQILFKVAQDAPDTEVTRVTESIQKVLELARAGKDFAALAKKYSHAPDAEDGGDMGYFQPGEMLADVENIVFNLDKGQVSDIVRTEYGIHFFKVEDKIPTTIKPLTQELIEDLRSSVITDTHWADARKRADRILETLNSFPDQFEILAKLHSDAPARSKGGRVGIMPRLIFPNGFDAAHLLGEVSYGTAVEREVSRAAFDIPVGGISTGPVRSNIGWHILKIHSRRPMSESETPPSDTDAAVVRATYQRLLSEQTLSQWLQERRRAVKIEYKIDVDD